jgi:hypothetical protein
VKKMIDRLGRREFDPADYDDDQDPEHPAPGPSLFDPDKFMDDWHDFADVGRRACPDCEARGEPCPYEDRDEYQDDDPCCDDEDNPVHDDGEPCTDDEIDDCPDDDDDGEEIVRSINHHLIPARWPQYLTPYNQ